MNCDFEGCESQREGSTLFCGSHNRMQRKAAKMAALPPKEKKPLAKVSGKMASQLSEYSKEKAKWIKGKMCVVFSNQIATTVHHSKGRVGYADPLARANGITLLMDKRYWVPTSMDGHHEIEMFPKWAKEKGYSFSRAENLY